MKRLVLITNDYPFDRGDASFVQHEIAALAAAYDEIHLFNLSAGESVPLVELPDNVSYRANLYRGGIRQRLPALLSLRNLRIVASAWWAEKQAGVLPGNTKTFLLAALAGAHFAGHPELRASIRESSAECTVYAFWGMGGALALPWLPRLQGGSFVRLHRYDLYEERAPRGYLPFRRSLFRSVNAVLAISDSARDYIVERYPDAGLESKVFVSRLGSANPGAVERAVRNDTRTIASCSSLIPVKRVDLILEAVARVAESGPVNWVHFGDGPLKDELLAKAAELGGSKLSIRLLGQTSNSDILDFYRTNRVDVFVNASESEGVPVSIMEAMSLGIPVVATAVGGTPEIVGRDLGSGELASEDPTAAELADTILSVLNAPDSRFQARSTWERMCDARVTAARTVGLLRGGRP